MTQDEADIQIGVGLVWVLRFWAVLLFIGIVWELDSAAANQCHSPPSVVLDEDVE